MLQDLLARFSGSLPERRAAPRIDDIPGTVTLDGVDYPLKDISQRGFALKRYSAEHYPGDRVRVTVCLGEDDAHLNFDCNAVVTWVNRRTRELAGAYLDLGPDVRQSICDRFPAMGSDK